MTRTNGAYLVAVQFDPNHLNGVRASKENLLNVLGFSKVPSENGLATGIVELQDGIVESGAAAVIPIENPNMLDQCLVGELELPPRIQVIVVPLLILECVKIQRKKP